jgi:transcriptional regulator with XRE-family HTH domain
MLTGRPRVTSTGADAMSDPWDAQREALGAFIRSQRKLANLSLRQLAEMTSLSNPYLSQIERGLHQPSVRVLKLISDALDLSAETVMAHAGLGTSRPGQPEPAPASPETEAVISADERLTPDQRAALIAVYRSMLRDSPATGHAPGPD